MISFMARVSTSRVQLPSSNTKQPVLTLLVHGDPAITNKKNPAITDSMSSEDVIEGEVKDIEALICLERPECAGLQEQKKVVVSLTGVNILLLVIGNL